LQQYLGEEVPRASRVHLKRDALFVKRPTSPSKAKSGGPEG
jgi:hypothetical protein